MKDIAKLKEDFLRDDFLDSLKWLFVGAVTWHAHPLKKDKDYLRAQGMFTSLVQARSLYEFFNNCDNSSSVSGGTVRAQHFVPSWTKPNDPKRLYTKYMAYGKPANRRVFHLVYGRANPGGGSMGGGSDELNQQVLEFARDLRRITEEFGQCLVGDPQQDRYRELVECALAKALVAGCEHARRCEILNPL